jgi:hypothetical protein
MAEPLFFQHCEEVDQFFREGRQFFNETYVKKLAQLSVYFTRTAEATWPLNTGTSQKGFRFGRGFYDPTKPWHKIVSRACDANSCDMQPERITRPDTESYTWDLVKKEMMSDWFCVEDLMYRLLPVEEVEQFEAQNAIITRSVHEEIIRNTYVGAAGHRWGATTTNVDPEDYLCTTTISDDFFRMQTFDAPFDGSTPIEGDTGFDSRYLYVNVPFAQLGDIATLSLDILDDALVSLGDEDEAYRVDLRDMGILKMDLIVPDPRVARKLYRDAKLANGWWQTDSEFDKTMSTLRLGIPRTIGDYTFAYDNNALRYVVDTVYSTSKTAPVANTPSTWPRLLRVMRYYQVKSEIGYKWLPNPGYKNADYGVTVHWMADAITKWRNPAWTGTGSVKMESQNYAGDFEWRRPDWECNPRGVMGFFLGQFRLGIQIKDPTKMHAFLHRIDNSKLLLKGECTPVANYTNPAPIETFVCTAPPA